MTHHDSLLNRVERLAKHIGRTEEIVARLQKEEYDLRHARDGAVRELQQVKADRDETEAKRKVLHEAMTELSQAAANFWPDQGPTLNLQTLMHEIDRLRAEIEKLKGAMDADDKRLLDAEERVWPELSYGCDAPEKMADEILYLRQQLANAQQELSEQGQVHGVELQRETADLRQQLDAAQAALTRERLDAEERGEKLDRLREDHVAARAEIETLRQQLNAARVYDYGKDLSAIWAQMVQVDIAFPEESSLVQSLQILRESHVAARAEIETLRQQLANAQREASDEFAERQVLQHEASDDYVELERLRAFVGKVQSVVDGITPATSKLCRICDALAALDDGTIEPAPAAEPTPCPKCKRWQRETERLNTEFVASTAEVIELRGHLVKLRTFVATIKAMMAVPLNGREFDEIGAALDELDAGTPEPAPVAETPDSEGGV